jgi:hypothetical protein
VLTAPFETVGGIFGQLAAEEQTADEASRNPTLIWEVVTSNFFTTFGIRVLSGRTFTDEDRQGAPLVAVLSESAARHYWPDADPIGKRLKWGPSDTARITVVGIVPETRYRDLRDPRLSIYLPLRQTSFPVAPLTLGIRSAVPSGRVIPALRRTVREVDPGVAVVSAAPFETFLEAPRAQPRLNALLLTAFAITALGLAAVGLFGVMTTMVRQRTRELGIRMALGATAARIGQLVLRRGVTLGVLGTSLGLLAAPGANRLLASMLFDVSPTDGLTLGTVAVMLLGVASLASLLPAWSSTRIDSVGALREE